MKNISQILHFGSQKAIDKVISHFPKDEIEVNGCEVKFSDMSSKLFDTLKELEIDGSEYSVQCPPDFTIKIKLQDGNEFTLTVKEIVTFPTVGKTKIFTILRLIVNENLVNFYQHLDYVPNTEDFKIRTAEINSCFGEGDVRDTYTLVIEGSGKYLRNIYDFKGVID